MKFNLKDKTAIITGGGSGKVMSETFAEMDAIVHVLDLNEAAGKSLLGICFWR